MAFLYSSDARLRHSRLAIVRYPYPRFLQLSFESFVAFAPVAVASGKTSELYVEQSTETEALS